jgi:rubrerythrin
MATTEHHARLRERLHLPHLHAPHLHGPHLRHDYRCDVCGYGAVALKAPARCPMCGGAAWSRG